MSILTMHHALHKTGVWLPVLSIRSMRTFSGLYVDYTPLQTPKNNKKNLTINNINAMVKIIL